MKCGRSGTPRWIRRWSAEQIREIKWECISEEIKASIDRRGRRPELFFLYLFEAVSKLKELIEKVRERVAEEPGSKESLRREQPGGFHSAWESSKTE